MPKKNKPLNAVKARVRRQPTKPSPVKEGPATRPIKRSAPKRVQKGYDAEKYTGAIPGLAERMKEYMRTMRDDR